VHSHSLTAASNQRLAALLWGGDDARTALGVYGLGKQRTLADYAAFSGIDYAARRIDASARKARFGY